MKTKYSIGIVCSGIPFNGNSLVTKSLGGSETGIIYLAKGMAARGHSVAVFCNCGDQGGEFNGVSYFDLTQWEELGSFLTLDVLIVSRFSQRLADKCKAKAIYFYCQDIVPQGNNIHDLLWQTDRIVLLSPYQRQKWNEVEPRYNENILEVRNGVDLTLIEKARKSFEKLPSVPKDKVNFIYSSCAERGLKPLLDMWPRILKKVPNAHLHVLNYDVSMMQELEASRELVSRCAQIISQFSDSITYHSKGLKKFDLYRIYHGCVALLYPCAFPEISCGVGSTKIKVPGGFTEFKDIKAGDLVYGFDEVKKRISLGRVKWSRKTKKRAEVWKLTYKWKEGCSGGKEDFVKFTPDHKFLLLDGTWRELQNLNKGDRLRPFYRHKDYGYTIVRAKGDYQYEHRMVKEFELNRSLLTSEVVHHTDGDKYNNNPENLEMLSQSAHMKIHEKQFRSGRVTAYKNYVRGLKGFDQEQYIKNKSKAGKALWEGMSEEERFSFCKARALKQDYSVQAEHTRKRMIGKFGNASWRDKEVMQRLYRIEKLSTVQIGVKLGCSDVCVGAWLKKLEIPVRDLSESQLVRSENHEVVSVEFCGYEDVYDMEVPGLHNFVANHIIAHNCITAIEAMATETLVISTNDYALVDTVSKDYGVLIDGLSLTEEYKKRFISAVDQFVNHGKYKERVARAREKVEAFYDWNCIVDLWLNDFDRLFTSRSESRPERVFQNLDYHNDFVFAYRAAVEKGYAEQEFDFSKVIERSLRVPASSGFESHHFPGNTPKGATIRQLVARHIAPLNGEATLLCVDSGIGDVSAFMVKSFPGLQVFGSSDSESGTKEAQNFYIESEESPLSVAEKTRLNFVFGDKLLPPNTVYDVFIAENSLDHVSDIKDRIRKIESCVKVGGLVVVITKEGPWESDAQQRDPDYLSGRVSNFEPEDLKDLLSHKKDFESQFVTHKLNKKDELLAYWVTSWIKTEDEHVGVVNVARKFLTYRPYKSLTLCMIGLNEEDNISKCLKSVRDFVDDVVFVDTGSTDDTKQIVKKLIPGSRLTLVGHEWDDDFSKARNAALPHAHGDWILWLDCDEELKGGYRLPKYLNSVLFPGFVIHQHHLTLDTEIKPDKPIRLFKNNGIKWFGVVHEQAETGMDLSVRPTIPIIGVNIAHSGYTSEDDRRKKCFERNMGLLYKDRKQNPDRRMGKFLLAREYRNIINYRLEELLKTHKSVTTEMIIMMREIGRIYYENFESKYEDPLHAPAFSVWQETLRMMVELNISVRDGMVGLGIRGVDFIFSRQGEPEHPKFKKIYFTSKSEYLTFCDKYLDDLSPEL